MCASSPLGYRTAGQIVEVSRMANKGGDDFQERSRDRSKTCYIRQSVPLHFQPVGCFVLQHPELHKAPFTPDRKALYDP